MKLTIERMGGFDIIESADVERIEVRSNGVEIHMTDGTKVTADREGHAESVATAAAIAVRCGTLVEALREAPEVDGEAAMGAASAALVRDRSRPWKSASEWAKGEPPRDGSTYVAREGGTSLCVRWDGKRWMAGNLPVVFGAGVEHRALGEGVAEGAGVSRWVEGEPPRDGRWYVVWMRDGEGSESAATRRWSELATNWIDADGFVRGRSPVAHLPTPIPER